MLQTLVLPALKCLVAAIVMTVVTLAMPAQADRFDALRADTEIENGVLVAAIGDIIRDTCPEIGQRRGRTLLALNGLLSRARSLGYSTSEIQAYVDGDAEKARVKAKARQWLGQQGARESDPASICALARSEIAKGSTIGRLMKVR
ncbi:MAG: DUF5333 domain-containing protein [Pseudomonadota bacterium]